MTDQSAPHRRHSPPVAITSLYYARRDIECDSSKSREDVRVRRSMVGVQMTNVATAIQPGCRSDDYCRNKAISIGGRSRW